MLNKTFEPKTVESLLYTAWEASKAFSCDPSSSRQPYTIMMPPPNVTGSLHAGHALTYTVQDMLIRFKRMTGFDVLWQPGTDHAGIATQMVVERQLAEKGVTRQDLGKEKFLEKVWEWKQESGDMIVHQQRRLGISPDWARARFTMDDGLCQAVAKVFVDLYKDGLIYRDKRLVNWDPKFQTAVSDLEVISTPSKGYLWYIRYQVVGEENLFLTVATTRPETLFGDTAVAVHPDDARYQAYIGRQVIVPFTGRCVPVVADEYCNPEKGSGVVKITPAHDFNDFEVGRRHRLPMLSIMDVNACLTDAVPASFQGVPYMKAREMVLEQLEAMDLLEKAEPIDNTVPIGERSGVEIQPLLTDQWFVDAHTLAQPAIRAVEEKKTQFVPAFWENTYFEWLRNIQPWCISRQIWWGHQIPAWYGPDGVIFVALSEEEAVIQAVAHYGKSVALTRDPDVLDTWFSSALWPFSTLGWPEKTPELARYYPGDVLDTGFDIIFFWVARMMMMGLHFMKEVPFKTVYIHALVRDEKGAKMSKSKGNVLDPLTLVDKYGCDALRFTLATLSVPGRDLKLSESRIEGSRNFMTKIWNAARFLQINECVYSAAFDPEAVQSTVNQWMIHEVGVLATQMKQAFESYRFDEACAAFYQFLWGNYCDYYLEFLKPLLASEDAALAKESRETAAWVLVTALRLAHPIIPFITDELWAAFVGEGLLINQKWPEDCPSYPDACSEMAWVVELIQQVRSCRATFNVLPTTLIPLYVHDCSVNQQAILDRHDLILKRLGRLSDVFAYSGAPETVKGCAQFVVSGAMVVVPLAHSIDIPAEVARLQKERLKVEKEIESCSNKLENPDFMTKAKPEIVEDMRERLAIFKDQYHKISIALERLEG